MVPRVGIAALGLLAMAGWMSGVSAADGALVPVVAVQDDSAELPRFEPSTDDFERQFAPFEDPAAVAVQPGAVDLATVDPIVEAPGEDLGEGVASWYGARFAGRKTASGERFDPNEYTAAHRTLPFGSRVRVTRNGRSVVVRINDRGPFSRGRLIDLSRSAAERIGLVARGHGEVQLALLGG